MAKAKIKIERLLTRPYGTLGLLTITRGSRVIRFGDARGEMFAIERGWHKNAPNVSCIPLGEYPLKRETVGRNMKTFQKRWEHKFLLELEGVRGRSQIQIHPGSSTYDTLGCIIPVHSPIVGTPKRMNAARHKHFHKDEIIPDVHGDVVRQIRGSGRSRVAYCSLYDAVSEFDVQSVVIVGCVG